MPLIIPIATEGSLLLVVVMDKDDMHRIAMFNPPVIRGEALQALFQKIPPNSGISPEAIHIHLHAVDIVFAYEPDIDEFLSWATAHASPKDMLARISRGRTVHPSDGTKGEPINLSALMDAALKGPTH